MLLGGCFEGAPRNNPLDPLGEAFDNVGLVRGRVTAFYPPFDGLAGVEVRIEPGLRSARTDADGSFSIDQVPPGRVKITATLPGYALAEDSASVDPGVTVELTLRMPGEPVVESFGLRTTHISRWWPPPQESFRVEVDVVVDDPDGLTDIERVWIEAPAVGLVDTLVAGTAPGQYLTFLQEGNLPVGVESLLGHPHTVFVRDRAGVVSSSNGRQLARVIEDIPVALTPTSLALLADPAPLLTWEPIGLDFPFTYRVDVVRVDENIQTVVQLIEDIASDATSIQLTTPLASGEYFWTVSVVDVFGNRSRSREAGFRIP